MGETCSAAFTCCDAAEQLPYILTSHVSIQQCYYSTQLRKQVCPGLLFWCTQIKILGGELRHFCLYINTRFKQHQRLTVKLYQWWRLSIWEKSIEAHACMCTLTFRGCHLNLWQIGCWLGFLNAFKYLRCSDPENKLFLLYSGFPHPRASTGLDGDDV